MKIAFFDDFRLGLIRDRMIVDVSDIAQSIAHIDPQGLISGLIEGFSQLRPRLEAALASDNAIALERVRLRPPLPSPRTIDCMAVNYMEDGTRSEPAPINGFHKAPSAIIGPGDTMVLPDVPAGIFEGEAELGVVIGRTTHQVSASNAMAHVFGYLNFIDGSARALPPAGNTFFQMKSRDTFAPIGPCIVTADEIPEPHNLQVNLRVNGDTKQDFNTDDMAHQIPQCIEWLSHIHTLHPGDLVATGTNHRGLSAFQDGDRVELEIERIGILAFSVRDDLKRTWSRDTRLEHAEKGLDGAFTPQLTGKYVP
ncbi:MAG: fumarylacetoacetate hydrolase family protein [Pseudomonadota bacterium]